MSSASWTITDADGELLLHTGVTGRVKSAGHRLTLGMGSWRVEVDWGEKPPHDDAPADSLSAAGVPRAVTATVDVDSLKVLSGEGGVTPLSDPEKAIARTNALKSLGAKKHPTITFRSTEITRSGDGYVLDGTLEIIGTARELELTVAAGESAAQAEPAAESGGRPTLSFDTTLTQTDFGIKPFSLMMGTVKVADDVRITFEATAPN